MLYNPTLYYRSSCQWKILLLRNIGITFPAHRMSYLKCQIIGANELLDQQEVAFSKQMHMADKVYICIKFVSLYVLYEIMWNTCVTLIYSFIMYILICTSRNLLQCCTSKSNVV